MPEFTREECDYVMAVLQAAHTQLLHDLHHTESRAFRERVRNEIEINERVTEEVNAAAPVPV